MSSKVKIIPAHHITEQTAEVKKCLRVGAYCRVSTDHEEQIGSFENQVEYYTRLIEENPDYELIDIYADEGISGTGTKKRPGFQRMLAACREKKVDLILTKSISRFARNTADCLKYTRELKDLGVTVRFEKEGIETTDATGELLFTILSSLAQEESRNISENTRWGIQRRFQQGVPHISTTNFMGYDKNAEGQLVVNPDQAQIVKRIYREFLEGWSCTEIAHHLCDDQIPGVTGRACWSACTIRRMLRNEKYKGDLLMQKWYTVSYLTKELAVNDGKYDQYYVHHAHEAIIDEEQWEAAQEELTRQMDYREKYHLRESGMSGGGQFNGRIVCGNCGELYIRRYYHGAKQPIWRCRRAEPRYGGICQSESIAEKYLQQVMIISWNTLVQKRAALYSKWSSGSTALERLRGRQMIELTAEGPIYKEIPELTRMVLREICILSRSEYRVAFLDGTEETVKLGL